MDQLEKLRDKIDKVDEGIIRLLAERFKLSKEVGAYKKKNGIEVLQTKRYNEILESRKKLAISLGMNDELIDVIDDIWDIIHTKSINLQK